MESSIYPPVGSNCTDYLVYCQEFFAGGNASSSIGSLSSTMSFALAGRPPSVSDEQVAVLLRSTLEQNPPAGNPLDRPPGCGTKRGFQVSRHRVFQLFACNGTAAGISNFPMIRSSWNKCAMWFASMGESIRRLHRVPLECSAEKVPGQRRTPACQRVMKMLGHASDKYSTSTVVLSSHARRWLLDPAKFLRIDRFTIVQSKSILELKSIENRQFTVSNEMSALAEEPTAPVLRAG